VLELDHRIGDDSVTETGDRTMPQDLSELWTSNAFGDISGWDSLPPEELHRECEEMISAWADNGWNVDDISPYGMIEFLKKEWANS
jgi:hypothetical protein